MGQYRNVENDDVILIGSKLKCFTLVRVWHLVNTCTL